MNQKSKEKWKAITASFLFLLFFLLGPEAQAALVPCGTSETAPCQTCDFLVLGKNISDFILFKLVPALAALAFIWAGFLILLGGGVPSQVQAGKNIFRTTVYGLLIIFLAWMIVNTVLRTVAGNQNIAENWWKLECREPSGPPTTTRPPAAEELVISDVQVVEITANSAVITWKTSKPGTSQVFFGDGRTASTLDSNPVINHRVLISGLEANKDYAIRAQSKDLFQSPAYTANSSVYIFKAGAGDGQSKPLGFLTDNKLPEAVLNQPYNFRIQAEGGTPPYTLTVKSGVWPKGLSFKNDGTISGTPTETTDSLGKNIEITLRDANPSSNPINRTFQLVVLTQVQTVSISRVVSSNLTSTGVTITWTTDKPATSQVEYGTTSSYGSQTPIHNTPKTSHAVALSGLQPNTTYNFRAVSSGGGYSARSSNYTFKTLTATASLTITTTSLSSGTINQDYSQTLQASGGKTPYAWSLASGALPSGLNLEAGSGKISGKPTKAEEKIFTIKVEDSSTPKQSQTKGLKIQIASALACVFNRTDYSTFNLCSGQKRPGGCGTSTCSQYLSAINKYAGGAASVAVLKTFLVVESDCNIKAGTSSSYGLMQLRPETANNPVFKRNCGVTGDITSAWLTDPRNADKSICLGAEFIKSLAAGTCGSEPRNIYAGYNAGPGNCAPSRDCAGEQSCGGGVKKKWECPYDNPEHTVCNAGLYQTKQGATYVNYCLNNLGF